MIDMVLPYLPPSANHMWVHSPYRHYLSTEYQNFKNRIVKDWIVYKDNHPEALPYFKDEKLFFRLVIHPKDRRVKFDLDNRVKALLDSLIGLCYSDDSQLQVMYLEKKLPIPKDGMTIISIRDLATYDTSRFSIL